jgi:hypothetical protein
MQDFQKRVISERDELRERWDRLNTFLASNPQIPNAELFRLRRQAVVMLEYLGILSERIDHFDD